MKRWLLRVAGSGILIGLLFWLLPRDAILQGLGRVPPLLFLGVWLGFLISHVAAAAKWWLILGRPCAFRTAIRAHFAGLAANLCLPGAVGGDAVRATMLHAAMRDAPRLAAGAVADRLIDTLALLLLSGFGVLMLGQGGVNLWLLAQAAVALILMAVVLGAVVPTLLPRLWDLFPRLPGRGFALDLRLAFGELARKPGLLLFVLVVSFLIQGVLVWLAFVLALATGVVVSGGAWVFAWPLAKILAILPISLGGLGLREATLAALLVPFGAVAAEVVAAGLAWQGVLFLTGGLGGLVVLMSRPRAGAATKTVSPKEI